MPAPKPPPPLPPLRSAWGRGGPSIFSPVPPHRPHRPLTAAAVFDALRVIATTRPDTVMASYTGISGRVRSLGGVPSALLTAARMLCNLLGSEDAAPQIIADRDTWKKLVQDCHACPMKDPSVSANLCCGYLQVCEWLYAC